MVKKIFLSILIMVCVAGSYYYWTSRQQPEEFLSPLSKSSPADIYKNLVGKLQGEKTVFAGKKTLNVLLIGIDRRSKLQYGFNTDAMILLSMNTETKQALLISIPRDLWINGNKINALYTIDGWESLDSAFEQVTGQEVDGHVRVDFEDFEWVADSLGGIPVNIERTFTDYTFPNRQDTDVITVTFYQGYEKMTGERALMFARSRKGNNGEGSDLMRAKRQHLLLQGFAQAIEQKESKFWPMDVPEFYEALITQGIHTTLTLDDLYYLWDFYKDRSNYQVESFVVGDRYIYYPGMYPDSPYHAWVFIPREGMLEQLHLDIQNKLNGTYLEPSIDGLTQSVEE